MAPFITGQVVCSISAEATSSDSGGAAGSDFLQPSNTINPTNKKLASSSIVLNFLILLFILFSYKNVFLVSIR
jgi:hypothetical protein